MGRIFDLDSPLMRGLNKMADVMWINVLVLIFALPLLVQQFFMLGPIVFEGQELAVNYVFYAWLFGIVCCIPLGPALTAMHFVLLKIVRDEESYITKTFFKSLKENFLQSAILMVIQFIAGGILLLDFMLMKDGNVIYRYIITAATIILFMASLYIFPLQAKFENSLPGTLKNSFLVAVMALPKTVVMAIVTRLPFFLLYLLDLKVMPLLFLLGIAGPGFLCAALYSETFKKFEPKEEAVSEEEELENAIKKIDDENTQ
jgi:uncharacterized membrane protein YesL